MSFYVYAHQRSDTDEIFYVGKGGGKRAWSPHQRSAWWKAIAAKSGGHRVEILAEFEKEDLALEYERCAIACYRAAEFPLCNITDGGEGTSGMVHTEAAKAKISAAGHRPCSPETREKIRAANKKLSPSPEAREKIRVTLTGRAVEPARIKALADFNRGRSRPPETKAKISAAHIGRKRGPMTEEHKEKIRVSCGGWKHSDEARAKISAARRATLSRVPPSR